MLRSRRTFRFLRLVPCLFAVILPLIAVAQPAVLASEMESGSYQTYLMEDMGIFRQAQVLAINDQPSGGATFAFIESDYGYDINWRPYSSGLILSSYNTTIAPSAGSASAVYNTGFGGADGRLPFITSGNYYTTNITEYSVPAFLQNEYMSVLETNYEPVDIVSLTQDPPSGVTEANNVLVSVTLSDPLSSGEYIYLRYSNTYNFTSSTIIELNSGSGFYFEYIPCSTDSIYYYVFTSNQDSAYIMSQVVTYGPVAYDMLTLDLINNGGPNYSYLPLFSIESCYYTLPIELLTFDLFVEQDLVHVFWETASEINADYFEVQRSIDGKRWDNIGTIAAQGNSNSATHYAFTDDEPFEGRSYYRLRMVDVDGSFSFSPVKSVLFSSASSSYIDLVPNPANSLVQMLVFSPSETAVQVSVKSISGSVIWQSNELLESGFQTILIDIASWASGVYIVEYTFRNGKSGQEKLLVTD
jgi:hypothetical protein